MKLKLLLLLVAAGCCRWAHAQSTTPQVIATGGAYYSAAGFSLSVTLGEMAAIETYSTATAVLTQGFQQPDIANVGIAPVNGRIADLSAFPNPASAQLSIAFTAQERGALTITLVDAQGKIALAPVPVFTEAGSVLQPLDLSGAAPGLYQVIVTFQPDGGVASRSVQTVSIVH